MGSSLGVSAAFLLLTRSTATQHAYLSEAITAEALLPTLPVTPEQFGLGASAPLQLLDLEITRQAMTIGYLNDFTLMMWVVLALVPLVFVLSGNRPSHAAKA
jgi:DHA2 family multidrug resistance protein